MLDIAHPITPSRQLLARTPDDHWNCPGIVERPSSFSALGKLAQDLDDLADSIVARTEPKRLSDLSTPLEQLENIVPATFNDTKNAAETSVRATQNSLAS